MENNNLISLFEEIYKNTIKINAECLKFMWSDSANDGESLIGNKDSNYYYETYRVYELKYSDLRDNALKNWARKYLEDTYDDFTENEFNDYKFYVHFMKFYQVGHITPGEDPSWDGRDFGSYDPGSGAELDDLKESSLCCILSSDECAEIKFKYEDSVLKPVITEWDYLIDYKNYFDDTFIRKITEDFDNQMYEHFNTIAENIADDDYDDWND